MASVRAWKKQDTVYQSTEQIFNALRQANSGIEDIAHGSMKLVETINKVVDITNDTDEKYARRMKSSPRFKAYPCNPIFGIECDS